MSATPTPMLGSLSCCGESSASPASTAHLGPHTRPRRAATLASSLHDRVLCMSVCADLQGNIFCTASITRATVF